MSDIDSPRSQRPAFQIIQPNPLLGSNTMILMNAAFTRSLCDLILRCELAQEDAHLYAFAKGVRRHYYEMSNMYKARAEGEAAQEGGQPEIVADKVDSAVTAG